jgi:hypothetical protein
MRNPDLELQDLNESFEVWLFLRKKGQTGQGWPGSKAKGSWGLRKWGAQHPFTYMN